MKKTLIALAAMGAASMMFVGTPAFAQSSVTLYGVADAGVGQIKSKGLSGGNESGAQMLSGETMNNGNSRLGVRGVEDLGSGLKAGFNFEDGLSLKNGQSGLSGGQFWSRQANVFIGSDQFGRLTMGRQFNPSYDTLAVWELTGQANYSVVGNTYGYTAESSRGSSQFKYTTPNFAGFQAEGSYITHADNNGDKGGRWDVGGSYVNGPIAVGLSANQHKGTKVNYQVGGKYTIPTSVGNFAVAASYDAANQMPGTLAAPTTTAPNVASPYQPFDRRGMSLGGSYMTGPYSVTLDVTHDFRNYSYALLGGHNYTNEVLEGKYALSKRTFVYAAFLHFDSKNNYGLGLRHNF